MKSLSLAEAVEEALCFGWIDGLLHGVDRDQYALRFCPRRKRSIWSDTNKRRVERLVREGRMTPAGLVKIREAKASGEWEAASARENTDTLPADLKRALRKDPRARAGFLGWSASDKKRYLYWLDCAKKPETREKRIQGVVEKARETVRAGRTGWKTCSRGHRYRLARGCPT